jgi:hypothetical protein
MHRLPAPHFIPYAVWRWILFAGLEVPATLTVSTMFWAVAPCRLIVVHRRFGEACCLHLQCRRVNQAGKQKKQEASRARELAAGCLACSSTLKIEALLPFELSVNFIKPHSDTSYKISTLHNATKESHAKADGNLNCVMRHNFKM